MEKPLDDNFVNELGVLNFGPKGTGFLSVDRYKWQEELYQLERLSNFNCLLIFALTFVLTIVPSGWGTTFLAMGVFGGYMYRRTISKRYKNLVHHGAYQYEIYDDRVVRYSDVWFIKIYFSEIHEIKKKNFGLLIIKNNASGYLYLNHKNPDFIVIPNKIQGFEQIEKHLGNYQNPN